MTGLSLDLYLIARMILESTLCAGIIAAAVFVLFAALWYAWPCVARHYEWRGKR